MQVQIKSELLPGMPEDWRRWRVLVDGKRIRSFKSEAGAKSWAKDIQSGSKRKPMKPKKLTEDLKVWIFE